MIANPDRLMCRVRACSHIHCKHEMHTCLFGRLKNYRGGRQAHSGFNAGQCDGRIWQSIRVYHDAVESNCRDGHRCGMGIVSGDVAKCECEPQAPIMHPVARKIESKALRGRVNSGAKIQALSIEADTKVCLTKGDVSKFKIKYHAGNNQPTSALAFKLQFDARFFTLKSAKVSSNPSCQLSGLASASSILTANQLTSIPYTCTSFTGAKIVPANDANVLEVELVAKGGFEGVTTVGVVPNALVHGDGYHYSVGAPIQLRYGHCGPSSWTVRPTPHQKSSTINTAGKRTWHPFSEQHAWSNDGHELAAAAAASAAN
jgi:hypothetical protein